MTQMQRLIKYGAMALAAILVVAIVSGIFTAVMSLSFLFGGGEKTPGEAKELISAVTSSSIDIDVGSTNIIIVISREAEGISVKTDNEYISASLSDSGKTLKIKEKSRLFNSTSYITETVITIPENIALENVSIDAGAGNIDIEKLTAKKLDMDLGAGNVDILYLDISEKADIDGGAGSISVKGGAVHNMDIDMGVGELSLLASLYGKNDIDCGVGKTDITLLGSKDDYKITLNKGIGAISVDGASISNGSTYGSGSNRLTIDGGMGEIKVAFLE